VLGFPFIFRGALDVRATQINEAMKIAAAHALAELARKDVPQVVNAAYGEEYRYGPDYIIPKPFDPRVLTGWRRRWRRRRWSPAWPAGAGRHRRVPREAAGAARRLVGGHARFVRKAAGDPRKIVFPEGDDPRILKAASIIVEERIARPVLLGEEEKIRATIRKHDIDLLGDTFDIVDPRTDEKAAHYAEKLHRMRERKGVTAALAKVLMREANHFGMMMVAERRVDGIVTGLNFAVLGHGPPGAADHRPAPRGAPHRRHVPDAAPQRDAVLRRHDGERRDGRRRWPTSPR
jgi:malate dehydrogenase (oxaloacetate-decarboxylating)(NADP+)